MSDVNFTCEGVGKVLTWIVNHTSIISEEKRQIMIIDDTTVTSGNLSSVLSIKALPINNGTDIGCVISICNNIDCILQKNGSKTFVGDEATLTIKGCM